jgi:hypothetical protein
LIYLNIVLQASIDIIEKIFSSNGNGISINGAWICSINMIISAENAVVYDIRQVFAASKPYVGMSQRCDITISSSTPQRELS